MEKTEVMPPILRLPLWEMQVTPIHGEHSIIPADITTIHSSNDEEENNNNNNKSESPVDDAYSVPHEKTGLAEQIELLAKYMNYETVRTDKDFASCFKSFLESQFTTELWTFCEKVREWKLLKGCSSPNSPTDNNNHGSNNNMDNNQNHHENRSSGDNTGEINSSAAYALQETIIEQYLQMSSNDELNVSKKIKDEVIDYHESMGENTPVTLFDQVLLNVQEQLSTEKFPTFVKSELFYSFIQRKQGIVEIDKPEMEAATAASKLATVKSPRHALRRLSVKVTGLFFGQQEQSSNSNSTNSLTNDKELSTRQKTKHLSVNHSIQKSFSLDEREFDLFLNNHPTKSTAKVYKSLPANRSYSIAIIDKVSEKKKRNKFLSFFKKQRN